MRRGAAKGSPRSPSPKDSASAGGSSPVLGGSSPVLGLVGMGLALALAPTAALALASAPSAALALLAGALVLRLGTVDMADPADAADAPVDERGRRMLGDASPEGGGVAGRARGGGAGLPYTSASAGSLRW